MTCGPLGSDEDHFQVLATAENQPCAAATGTRPARRLFGFTKLERRILNYCARARHPGLHHSRLCYWTRKGNRPVPAHELEAALDKLIQMGALERRGDHWTIEPSARRWALRPGHTPTYYPWQPTQNG